MNDKNVNRLAIRSSGPSGHGMTVTLDGAPVRCIQRLQLEMGMDAFTLVTLVFAAEVDADVEVVGPMVRIVDGN